jgi:hypothetical protein
MGEPIRCVHLIRAGEYISRPERTWGSEPSQYPEEEKTTVIPIVVASELGTA